MITLYSNQLDENQEAVVDEAGGELLTFRQPVELVSNPGPSSNLGKMLLAWGEDTENWVGKKFFASLKTIEGRPTVDITPIPTRKKSVEKQASVKAIKKQFQGEEE